MWEFRIVLADLSIRFSKTIWTEYFLFIEVCFEKS